MQCLQKKRFWLRLTLFWALISMLVMMRNVTKEQGVKGALPNVFYVSTKHLNPLFGAIKVPEEQRDSFYSGWWARSESCDSLVFSENYRRDNYYKISIDAPSSISKLEPDLKLPKDTRLIFSDDLEIAGYIDPDFKAIKIGKTQYTILKDTRFQAEVSNSIFFRINPCNYKLVDFICVESVLSDHGLYKKYSEDEILAQGLIKFYISHVSAPTQSLVERRGHLMWCSFLNGTLNLVYTDSMKPKSLTYERLKFIDDNLDVVFKKEVKVSDPDMFLKIFDYCDEKKQLLVGRHTGSWETLLPRHQYLELYDFNKGEQLGRRVMPSDATAGIFICPEGFDRRKFMLKP